MHFYNLSIEEVGKLTHRQYMILFEQVYNLKKFDFDGKIDLISKFDKQQQQQAAKEYKELLKDLRK